MSEILVKEFYSNGQIRLKGYRTSGERVGVWKWWREDGQDMATVDYHNNTWFYIQKDGEKISKKGLYSYFYDGNDNEPKDFSDWLTENNFDQNDDYCDCHGYY